MPASATTESATTLAVALAVLGLGVTSIVLFAIRNRGRRAGPPQNRREHSVLVHNVVRQWWLGWAGRIGDLLIRRGVHPNTLTLFSLLLSATAAVLFATGLTTYAGFSLFFAGACDSLDGIVARGKGLASKRGTFLDSSLDRAGEIVVFSGLCVLFRHTAFLFASIAAMGGALMVSYARARGQALGVDFDRGLMLRPERIVYLSFGGILDPMIPWILGPQRWSHPGLLLGMVVSLVALLSVLTAIYRILAIAKQLQT